MGSRSDGGEGAAPGATLSLRAGTDSVRPGPVWRARPGAGGATPPLTLRVGARTRGERTGAAEETFPVAGKVTDGASTSTHESGVALALPVPGGAELGMATAAPTAPVAARSPPRVMGRVMGRQRPMGGWASFPRWEAFPGPRPTAAVVRWCPTLSRLQRPLSARFRRSQLPGGAIPNGPRLEATGSPMPCHPRWCCAKQLQDRPQPEARRRTAPYRGSPPTSPSCHPPPDPRPGGPRPSRREERSRPPSWRGGRLPLSRASIAPASPAPTAARRRTSGDRAPGRSDEQRSGLSGCRLQTAVDRTASQTACTPANRRPRGRPARAPPDTVPGTYTRASPRCSPRWCWWYFPSATLPAWPRRSRGILDRVQSPALDQEHVFGLQIAVHDSLGMRGPERLGYPHRHAHCPAL